MAETSHPLITTGNLAPVVQGSLDAYRHAEGWSYYASNTVEYPAPPAPPYTPLHQHHPQETRIQRFLSTVAFPCFPCEPFPAISAFFQFGPFWTSFYWPRSNFFVYFCRHTPCQTIGSAAALFALNTHSACSTGMFTFNKKRQT